MIGLPAVIRSVDGGVLVPRWRRGNGGVWMFDLPMPAASPDVRVMVTSMGRVRVHDLDPDGTVSSFPPAEYKNLSVALTHFGWHV